MAENVEYEKETIKVELEQFRFYGTFLIGLITVIGGLILKGDYTGSNVILLSISSVLAGSIVVVMAVKIEKIYVLLKSIKRKQV